MFKAIVHVGNTVFDFSQGEHKLIEAVRTAEARYRSLGISGVTVITPKRFAQLFEGPPDTVDQLYGAIKAEWPGANMRLLETSMSPRRRFRGWDMAYFGRSAYIEQAIEPLDRDAADPQLQSAIRHLRRLLEEFGASSLSRETVAMEAHSR